MYLPEETIFRIRGFALTISFFVGCLIFAVIWGSPAIAAAFDGERAYDYLKKQCDFGPRVPGTEAHTKTGAYLERELRKYANKVEKQTFARVLGGKEVKLTNYIATFDYLCPIEIVEAGGVCKPPTWALVGAHWDSRPTADKERSPTKRRQAILGANDGASGTAVVLELARQLQNARRYRGVILVLFDGEDYGPGGDNMYLGSKYFASHYTGPKPEWAVVVDMVGDKNLRLPIEGYSRKNAPGVLERIWRTAERVGQSEFVREKGPYIMDDHVPLQRAGIEAIDVIDFTYPYWHTLEDTPDKCSAESLESVGAVVLEALLDRR